MRNNTKITGKTSNSGRIILELLKTISKKPLTALEFFRIIESNKHPFNKEAMWKYINTLKMFGFDVIKDKDKYYVNNVVDKTDYNETDLSLIKFIEIYAKQPSLKLHDENFSEVLFKIEKTISESAQNFAVSHDIQPYVLEIPKHTQVSVIQKFEKYCRDGLKLNIKYKVSDNIEKSFKISPIKIILKKHKAVLIAYDCKNCEYKEFLLNFITHDEQTPQKGFENFTTTVIFKLKDRLAKSYVLKEGEKLLEYNKNYSVIANSGEDKSLLLKRLLRYYDNCEITYPADFRKKMINLIEEIEEIYD